MSNFPTDGSNLSQNKTDLLDMVLMEQGSEFNSFPLSFAQQRLWFLSQLDPDSAAYNIITAVRLKGRLDRPALEWSLNEVVRRHEALRTTFVTVGGQAVQLIGPPAPLPLGVVGLAHLPAGERQAALEQLMREEAQRPFDIGRGPLLRVRLYQLDERTHVLLLAVHHIVSDGWSSGVLVREVALLYGSFLRGQPSPLQELPIQYADYAVWQRGWLRGEVLERQLRYWRSQLAGAPAVLELPTDRPRPPVQTYRGATLSRQLPPRLSEHLKELSRAEGVTLFMTLLAAFQLLLSRYTGQEQVVVGTDVANRNRAEVEGLIGFFVNQLVLRTDLSGDPTFRELLGRVREVCLGAYAHQDVPFERLVEELQPERDLSRNPLFQVMFILQNTPSRALELPGLEMSMMAVDNSTTKFDLTLSMEEAPGGLWASVEYNTELFDAERMERMLGHFERLLRSISEGVERPVSRLEILGDEERRQVLEGWNATAESYEGAATLHGLFEAQAERTPEAVAVVFEGEELTYAELNSRANRLARHLRGLGVGPESVVGVLMERSSELVVALLGVLKAGGAYLPFDPLYPPRRLAEMLRDARPRALVTHGPASAHLPAPAAEDGAAAPPVVDLDADKELIAAESPEDSGVSVSPDNLAYVIYTSGSTGRPKGVMNTHGAIRNRLLWMQAAYGLTGADAVLQKTPYSFDVSVWEFFWPLLSGARLVVARPGGHRDGDYLAEVINAQGVTTVHFVPSMLRPFVEGGWLSRCAGLRRVVCSGEALSYDLQERFFAASGAELHNLYGPTEAAVDVTAWACERGGARRVVPIGRPIANTRVYVLDAAMRPVPAGVAGELYLGGVGLARGYLGRPSLTAERFVPDPFGGGGRLYRTGDVARHLAGGEVEYLGRADHQVKVRGFRIELGEVEAALLGHEGVRAAVVTTWEPAPGDVRLAAYVVWGGERGGAAAELRRHTSERLPDYMVPPHFVELGELPLTASGKVDRRALPEPDAARPDLSESFVPPGTEVEEVLAAIWSRVLGVEPVGVHDNFFALGGDSIRSLRVLALAKERGLRLSLQQLFQYQTIRGLAEVLRPDEAAGAVAARAEPFGLIPEADRLKLPDDVEDAYPLSMLQAGMLYHMELTPDAPLYHNVNSLHLRARFDPDAFRRAVQRCVERHATLRTSFDFNTYGEPLQLVHRHAVLEVGAEDISALGPAEQEALLDAFIEAESRRRFDPARPPQMRFHLHRRSEETFQFTLTESHAVSDGWSLHSTLAEIFGHYFALLDGEALPDEPAPSVSYRDFVVLERAALDSEEFRQFWARYLSEYTPAELPAPPRPAREDGGPRIRIRHVPVPAETSAGLKRLAQSAAVPLKSVLLAAHFKVMSIITGADDVATGVTFNGRPEEVDGDLMRGLFLNTIPFRLRLPRGTWRELAQETFRIEREMLPFRRYPMAALQKQWGRQPIYETAFNFVHFHVVEKLLRSGDVEVLDFKKIEETNFKLLAGFSQNLLSYEVGLELDYDATHFSEEQIEGLAGYYLRVLGRMAEAPSTRHETQCLLPAGERERIVNEWNRTRADGGPALPTHELFEAQARRTPEAVAVVFEDEELTYAELNKKANQLAHYLRSSGVGPESVVGVLMERSTELVVALLGVLKAGGAYLPLDPSYPPARLSFMLGDAGPRVVLTQRRLLGLAPGATQALCLDEDWDLVAGESDDDPGVAVSPENLAYVIYTSGSTGRPKGVMIAHRGLSNYLRWCVGAYDVAAGRGAVVHSSLSFDLTITGLYAPLLAGRSVVLVNESRGPEGLVAALRGGDYSLVKLTPAHLELLSQSLRGEEAAGSTRALVIGGEALWAESLRFWREHAPGTRLFNEYGPTETVVGCCVHESGEGDARGAVPIGRPIANLRMYVLDGCGAPVPVGVKGELYIGGVGVGRGYLKRPALTAERFVPDPYAGEAGARMYRTGDAGRYLESGELEYLGRLDQQVKVRGYRIELGEIEAVLRGHDGVRECAVVAREDAQGEKRLVAYVVAEPGGGAGGLRAYAAERLPEYMVPAAFVALDELPLTPGGKVDRKALPEPEGRGDGGSGYVAPRTAAEELLAGVWSEVLGVERVGAQDNFFELGGHSLLAIQVISRVRDIFGVESPLLQAMFDRPTLEKFSQYVEETRLTESGRPVPPLVPVARGGDLPLSFAQQRLWFLDQIEPGSPFYNIPVVMHLNGPLDTSALRRTLNEVVRRHEALRTVFPAVNGSPAQVILPELEVALPTTDLSDLPEAERQAKARRLANQETQRPFDLARGPLVRARLLRLGEREHVATFTMHHIVSDGWSMGVLTREVAALYEAYSRGGESPLAELPVQYADYAVWQRGWLQGETLEAEVDYWRERLAGAPTLQLPTDRPRPAVQTFRGKTLPLQFSAALSQELRALSRSEGATLFMTLLAAFQLLLSRYTGQEQVVVGTDVAGRTRPELEGLIGFFVNQLVLRTDLSGDPTFRELLGRVREVCLGAYQHQDVPFDRLVKGLKLERDVSRAPLFQVKLILQNAPTAELGLSSLTLRPAEVEAATAKFDLMFGLEDTAQGLRGGAEYNVDLFDEATVRRMMAAYEALLERAAREPGRRLSELSGAAGGPRERRQQETQKVLKESGLKKLRQARREAVRATPLKVEGTSNE